MDQNDLHMHFNPGLYQKSKKQMADLFFFNPGLFQLSVLSKLSFIQYLNASGEASDQQTVAV